MKTSLRLGDIAERLRASLDGDAEALIRSAAAIESAEDGDITFAYGKAIGSVAQSAATAIVVPIDYPNSARKNVIRSARPREAFAQVLEWLYPAERPAAGIDPTAAIDPSAQIDPSCHIGPHVSVGARSVIGAQTQIGSGCVVAADVTIGSDCLLHPRVTLYSGTRIGDRVILHSGSVIGADGFGFAWAGDGYRKFPQVGIVEIADDVEIGANACIDRAALGVTAIGRGTKLDNMVHIGHNCRIGAHVVIAAQTGLSGGVIVEDYAVIGGQVGIGDKARIRSRAVLGSGSGILTSKIVNPGEPVWGVPARPLRQHLEQLANLTRLPKLREEVKRLRSRVEQLESKE